MLVEAHTKQKIYWKWFVLLSPKKDYEVKFCQLEMKRSQISFYEV